MSTSSLPSVENFPDLPLLKWGKSHSVVVSSRLRLARNLATIPFPNQMGDLQKKKLVERLKKSLSGLKEMQGGHFYLMENLSSFEKQLLVERHLISKDLAGKARGSGAFVNQEETLSFMINEEDHLRMQAILTGFQLKEALAILCRCEEELERSLEFAFDARLGYLTSCPSNVGTGMRASVMLHLPGLVLSDQINPVMQAINKMHYAVRGLYGEGSEAFGNLFQVSNQMTLGQKEEDIVAGLETLMEEVIEHETNARYLLLEQKSEYLLDHIGRAYGILSHAYSLNTKEALTLLSLLKLGSHLQFFPPNLQQQLDQLIMETQPAHLQQASSIPKLSAAQRDHARAEKVRKVLAKVPSPQHPASLP